MNFLMKIKLCFFVLTLWAYGCVFAVDTQDVDLYKNATGQLTTLQQLLKQSDVVSERQLKSQFRGKILVWLRDVCTFGEMMHIQRNVQDPCSRLLLAYCDAVEALTATLLARPISSEVNEFLQNFCKVIVLAKQKLEAGLREDNVAVCNSGSTVHDPKVFADLYKKISYNNDALQPYIKSTMANRLSDSDVLKLNDFLQGTTFEKLKKNWQKFAASLSEIQYLQSKPPLATFSLSMWQALLGRLMRLL